MRTQVETEHGFVVIRPDGRRIDDTLHPTRESAALVSAFLNGASVAPAKRLTTYAKRRDGTLEKIRSEIIVDYGKVPA